MAKDFSKYSVSRNDIEILKDLNKGELSREIVKLITEENLVSNLSEFYSGQFFNNFKLCIDRNEFDGLTQDQRDRRYSKIDVRGGELFVTNQWTLDSISKFNDYINKLNIGIKIIKSNDTIPNNYYWLVAAANTWLINELEVGDTKAYTTYNNGNARQVIDCFNSAKEGELVIGYQGGTDYKEICGLFCVSHSKYIDPDDDVEKVEFELLYKFDTPIKYEEIETDPLFINARFVKMNNAGSLFTLTAEEFNRIIELIKAKNPQFDLNKLITEEYKDPQIKKNIMDIKSLNTILYGPPGTGKTFSTIDAALQVILGKEKIENKSRTEKTTDFRNQLIDFEKESGQIAFTTFHQSMSYEDFIEGIKPIPPAGKGENISYEIIPGIFKKICDLARKSKDSIGEEDQITMTEEEFNAAEFIKINFKSTDIEIAKNCIIKNIITFFNDIPGILDISNAEFKKKHDDKINSISAFIKPSKNLYFILTVNEDRCLGIGKADGDYSYKDPRFKEYNHTRSVNWFRNTEFPSKEVLKPSKASQGSILLFPTESNEKYLKKEFFTNPQSTLEVKEKKEIKKFVLIIDEINRGNIAQIFGELITLIEDEKRETLPEELRVILPYSKESFSVPENVYIIGTMNTADRSVEALDTALRRRFSFIELAPNEKHEEIDKKVIIAASEFNFQDILETINKRIEKLIGRDHKIGHSYFIQKNGWTWENYLHAFSNKIVPLMQEYFFGDYGKMRLVLGQGFVDVKELNGSSSKKFFANEDHENIDEFNEKPIWELKPIRTEVDFKNALNILLNK
jgi:predicted RNA-binding protein with PUA-like domain